MLLGPLAAFLSLILVFKLPALAHTEPIAASLVDGRFQTLVQSNPAQPVRILVHMAETANLPTPTASTTRLDQRTAVIHSLKAAAAASQAALRQQLDSWQASGDITKYHSFWINNSILVTTTAKLIDQIAAYPNVAAITLDEKQRYFDPPDTDFWQIANQPQPLAASNQPPNTYSWGVARINAPQAWHGLGIDGSGVTIAIVDSGVDWLHPDLWPNYRGNLGSTVNHSDSWFHAVHPTIIEPMDPIGHGTHVAGTAVGQNGIGTAPGAQWMAVAISDSQGYIYDSDVHRAFEWLLAPNGDPALAPDIINNSWGGNPYRTTFIKDIDVLQAAGIITVFSAGNSGPFPESIESPANLTDTLSVAATDEIDAVAWYSSRGPSVLTDAQNPWLAAPGSEVLSALPNGSYGFNSGTSMATPHVSGAIALLLSANPNLTRPEILQILAQTAVPIAATHPNNNSGWGLLDAYAAVSTQVVSGISSGVVRSGDGPIVGANVVISTSSGAALELATDEDGRYQAALAPGTYQLTAAPYGYAKGTAEITITANQTTTHNFELDPLPGGIVRGTVRSAATNQPVPAAIVVAGTPVEIFTDVNGHYQLTLPQGPYTITAAAAGYRSQHTAVTLINDQTIDQDFTLEPAPTILLVDGGKWYFESYADYYEESLAAQNYSFDTWTIRDPYLNVPNLDLLANYDVVIWSSPLDSPGYIGAGKVISDYLGLGGNFLVSGQDVAALDGYGFGIQTWWHYLLDGQFMGEIKAANPLTGTAVTLFDGITLTLNGPGSAQNQTYPDLSRPRTNSMGQATFQYDDGLAGGLYNSLCQPYQIAYFGFGLEGIPADERSQILERSLATFALPPQEHGVRWDSTAVDDFALAGSQLVYTLTLRNMSETVTDTFQLNLSGGSWPTTLITKTVTLGTCQTGQTVLTIDVPADLPDDFVHEMAITAVSTNQPATSAALNLRHKTPGDILLVDDDRWYDQQAVFRAMLDAMNLPYDVWDIGGDNNKRGSPPQAILNAYDIILWYTAYDWFAPVTAVENQRLTNYLAQGGRLFLTSQDFLYYHHQTKLATHYFGVADYYESIKPYHIYSAGSLESAPDLAGPLLLDYTLYKNNGDGVIPHSGSHPYLWTDQGMAAGSAAAGTNWRTIFLGFPLEKLPAAARPELMNQIVGWLSDLGDSTFTVDQSFATLGQPRTYTITLRNLPQALTNTVSITNTLPPDLRLLPQTVSGGAVFDAAARQLTWGGILPPDGRHQITYRAVPQTVVSGTRLDNQLQIYYDSHEMVFTKTAPVWIETANLSQSTITAVSTTNTQITPTQTVTYTMHIINNGAISAKSTVATMRYFTGLQPITETLTTTGGAVFLRNKSLVWEGRLSPASSVTVTLALTRNFPEAFPWLPVTAVFQTPSAPLHLIYQQLNLYPNSQYFPLIAKTE